MAVEVCSGDWCWQLEFGEKLTCAHRWCCAVVVAIWRLMGRIGLLPLLPGWSRVSHVGVTPLMLMFGSLVARKLVLWLYLSCVVCRDVWRRKPTMEDDARVLKTNWICPARLVMLHCYMNQWKVGVRTCVRARTYVKWYYPQKSKLRFSLSFVIYGPILPTMMSIESWDQSLYNESIVQVGLMTLLLEYFL